VLFNIVLEAIVRQAKVQTLDTIFIKQTQLFGYVSDIDIVGSSLEVVRDAYLLSIGGISSKSKAEDQQTKDKIHDCGWKRRTILDAGQTVAFGDRKNFKVNNEFVYLGALGDTRERRGFGDTAINPNCK
jgi:hypothetical protein